MITRFYILFLFLIISLFGFSQESNIVDGEVLVMLNKNESVINFIEQLNNKNPKLNIKLKQSIAKRINVWLISFNSNVITNKEFLNKVKHTPLVEIAQFNHTNIQLRDTCPDDTYFATNQWALNNTGQFGAVPGVDIDACKAWDLHPADTIPDTTYYGDEIVVAVIDDGFDVNHNDINYFVNTNEIPNDSIDNDGNGYIDDVIGWNVYNNTGTITTSLHGTHVAGTIGAKGNNNQGVSGVAPGVTILPIQGSHHTEAVVLQSYGYVLEMRDRYDSTNGAEGAYIVATNSSFGVDYGNPASYPLWCAFYDSMGTRGILSCAATSNGNINVDVLGDIPTTCTSDWLITVNATASNDTKYSSGFGAINIDLGAPGTGIYSTIPGNNYGSSTGTSQAVPHVTGSIAFIYAIACSNFMQTYDTNPGTTALLIKDAILGKVDPNPNLAGITVSGGRLNLYEAAYELKTYGLCSLTDTKELIEVEPTIEIYPNPNNGKFKLKINNISNKKHEVIVYDVLGNLVYNEMIKGSESSGKDIYLKDGLAKGLYFLCLKSYNDIIKTIKFVKE
jgi:hypothetical protein